jgi:heme/copper-type cytochrome/quinol oxidase subunit 4
MTVAAKPAAKSAATSAIVVWLVLMLITAASTWGLSLPAVSPTLSTVGVMLIAAIKVALVMACFMELRGAPRPWQLAGAIWVIAAASAVVTIYLL